MAGTAKIEILSGNNNDKARTNYPVHDLIRRRRSARVYSTQDISPSEINTILEAASWAPSSMNEQPWQYKYAHKGSHGFNQILDCLMEGNRKWAKDAPILMISIAQTRFSRNQRTNIWAAHDVGMANSNLLIQAVSMDIFGRVMGGFHKDQLKELFHLNEDQDPICVIALGYREDPDKLDAEATAKEYSPRSRFKVEDFVQKLA
jgi:nitroreductase